MLLRGVFGLGFSATAFIERRRPSVQKRRAFGICRAQGFVTHLALKRSVTTDGSTFSLPFKRETGLRNEKFQKPKF
jgi:hypothetical protein